MNPETFHGPMTVEGVQLTSDADWDEIAEWCGGELHTVTFNEDPETWLHLPSGSTGTTDDWVIRYATKDGPGFAIVGFDRETGEPDESHLCELAAPRDGLNGYDDRSDQ